MACLVPFTHTYHFTGAKLKADLEAKCKGKQAISIVLGSCPTSVASERPEPVQAEAEDEGRPGLLLHNLRVEIGGLRFRDRARNLLFLCGFYIFMNTPTQYRSFYKGIVLSSHTLVAVRSLSGPSYKREILPVVQPIASLP